MKRLFQTITITRKSRFKRHTNKKIKKNTDKNFYFLDKEVET